MAWVGFGNPLKMGLPQPRLGNRPQLLHCSSFVLHLYLLIFFSFLFNSLFFLFSSVMTLSKWRPGPIFPEVVAFLDFLALVKLASHWFGWLRFSFGFVAVQSVWFRSLIWRGFGVIYPIGCLTWRSIGSLYLAVSVPFRFRFGLIAVRRIMIQRRFLIDCRCLPMSNLFVSLLCFSADLLRVGCGSISCRDWASTWRLMGFIRRVWRHFRRCESRSDLCVHSPRDLRH